MPGGFSPVLTSPVLASGTACGTVGDISAGVVVVSAWEAGAFAAGGSGTVVAGPAGFSLDEAASLGNVLDCEIVFVRSGFTAMRSSDVAGATRSR